MPPHLRGGGGDADNPESLFFIHDPRTIFIIIYTRGFQLFGNEYMTLTYNHINQMILFTNDC